MALSADRDTKMRAGELYSIVSKSGEVHYKGAGVAVDGNGEAVAPTATTGLRTVGRAEEQVDNTSDGEVVTVRAGCFKWKNSSGDALAESHIHTYCYWEDDETVCATGSGKSIAGIVVDVDSDGVWVLVGPLVVRDDADLAVDGTALADGKLWLGNGSGVAAAVTPSGQITMTNAGVVALAIASQAQGDLIARGASAWARLAAATAGQLVMGDGTDVVSQALSGDIASISGAGATLLAKTFIRQAVVNADAAAVIAMNATPIVLVDHSALVAAGTIAAGDVLVFHDCILNINGGSTNYDQNQNCIVKYQTAGGGATVSTTLANFFNGGADGALSTCKQLTTDVVPEADQDLVMTSSASPYAAAGDRLCRFTTYYSVFTPA